MQREVGEPMGSNVVGRAVVVCTLVVGGLVSLFAPAPVRAATVTANVFFDRANGPCAATGTGECTLRETVIYANAHPGTTINLLAGTYTLTLGTPTFSPTDTTRGALILKTNVAVVGAGRDASVVDASMMGTNTRDRVFLVSSGGKADIRGVTIRGGQMPTYNIVDPPGGGGILVLQDTSLSISDSVITGNMASRGGGIHAIGALVADNVLITDNDGRDGGGINGTGVVTITNSTVSNNRFGGIFGAGTIANSTIRDNVGKGVYGAATITNSEISNNSGGGVGYVRTIDDTTIRNNSCGGVYVAHRTEIIDSRIIANTMTGACEGSGAGIVNDGTVIVDNSVIEGNIAGRRGGGIYHALPQNRTGTVTIRNGSRIVGNRANGPVVTDEKPVNGGGGILAYGYTVNADDPPSIIVTDSTIADNHATDRGGGVYLHATNATFTNTTVSGNQAGGRGGGIAIETGSAYAASTIPITNTTISGNIAQDGGGIWSGLYYTSGGNLTLTNVTLAGNSTGIVAGLYRVTARNSVFANTGANCSRSLTSDDHNLSSDTTCTSFTQPHDRTNTDPKLGPLANNGGLTQTHALLPGSPAIDAGGTSANGCPATDQRGIARPQGTACDIGAFEAQPLPVPPSRPVAPIIGNPAPQPPPRPGAPAMMSPNPAPVAPRAITEPATATMPPRQESTPPPPTSMPPPAPPLPNPLPPRR